jgi:hypothetical protein
MSSTATVVNINRGKPMPSSKGYVMAWRDIGKQTWYKKPEYLAIFTHIMLNATSKPMQYNRKGCDVNLLPGDYVTTYDALACVFNLDKSKVRRILAVFEKQGQITKSLIAKNGINKGFVVTLTGWEKWQNTSVKSDTQPDTQSDTQNDTLNITNIKGFSTHTDTQNDTQPNTLPDTVLNNNIFNKNILNKEKRNAGSATQPVNHSKIRESGFEYFWKVWGNNKKLIGKINTAPKQTTKTKFLSIMTESHVNKMGVEQFRAEINQICELINFAHNDIAEKQGTKQQSDFFNFESMYPAKFLGNKQWRDLNGDQE